MLGLGIVPNRVVNDSAAWRKSEVSMVLSCAWSTLTSANDFLIVSKNVPPGGTADVVDMAEVLLEVTCFI